MKQDTRDGIVGLLAIIFIVWLGFTLVGNYKEHKAEKKAEENRVALEKQISSIDFSDVNNASKDIDKILKPKVSNYKNSDIFKDKDKYSVDVYVNLKSTNRSDGANELTENLPVVLDTLFKNNKIDSVLLWGNAKTEFEGKTIEDNFMNVEFTREKYNDIKDFKKLVKDCNGIATLEKGSSHVIDIRYGY